MNTLLLLLRESSARQLGNWNVLSVDGVKALFMVVVVVAVVLCLKFITELRVDLSELDGAIEGRGVLAGESIGLVVAGQGGLIEDGSIAADEAPVSGFDNLTGVVLNRQADVEDLAVVLNVSVVAVSLTVALKGGLEGGLQEGLGISGKAVCKGGGRGLGG